MTSLFMNLLNWIDSWVGSYGWSIVLFTLFVRLVLLPLDIRSKKSMRAIQKIQPKLNALQKKYANDKEKLNAKTMELYRRENVSPTAGCLPMLIQLPLLWIMFSAMRSVGDEHTLQMILDLKNGAKPVFDSWLWIKNVFQPDSFGATILPAVGDQLLALRASKNSLILTADNIAIAKEFLASAEYAGIAAQYGTGAFMHIPLNLIIARPMLSLPNSFASLFQYANGLFILPILAGASQFLMTKLTGNEQPKDQQQQSDSNNPMNNGFMKWFFPIFSVWICASSNAAFSIYWMAANVIQIVQQLAINAYFKHVDEKEAAAANQASID